jgi:hypothetical protein
MQGWRRYDVTTIAPDIQARSQPLRTVANDMIGMLEVEMAAIARLHAQRS